jgi:hypothetical protein
LALLTKREREMDGQAIDVHGRIAFSNANWALPRTTELVAILSGFLHA